MPGARDNGAKYFALTFVLACLNFALDWLTLPVRTELPFAPGSAEKIITTIAQTAHGFVPADLQYLCGQVAMRLVEEENLQKQRKPKEEKAVIVFGAAMTHVANIWTWK